MSLSATCDAILAVSEQASQEELTALAVQCESHLSNVKEIVDAIEHALSMASSRQMLKLWFFVDRLAKQHAVFIEGLRGTLVSLLTRYHPAMNSEEWNDFRDLLTVSFSILFGKPLVSLVLTKIETDTKGRSFATPSSGDSTAVALQSSMLRTAGSFMTKNVTVDRPDAVKHRLQVKTLDSQVAMATSSSYAPAKPAEIAVPQLVRDADAPEGYMKAPSANEAKEYREDRRKRYRDVMEKSRQEQDRRQEEQLLSTIRKGPAREAEGESEATPAPDDFSDITLPVDFPRDEFGVKKGNYPRGVRFIKNALKECGGALELNVLENRLRTHASNEAVTQFGDVREFIQIHSPSFKLSLENDVWIVRLADAKRGAEDTTWVSMPCPACSKIVKGRNLARHLHCRKCVVAQMGLGLKGKSYGTPIVELAYISKVIIQLIEHREPCSDFELDCMAESLAAASLIKRYRLSSTRTFAPVLKALRLIRERWLEKKGVEEMSEATVTAGDGAIANLFNILGKNVHRLPIAWIELGDIIDMCSRFCDGPLPPHNPPPRPADPRISLDTEYPGFLFCESDVDSEDRPSTDEDAFSDDEGVTFTFAPPVSVAESLFTAGFARDTKKLQHRMRTAPPMIHERVLKTDFNQTQDQLYSTMNNSNSVKVPGGQSV
ncbi:hypothetical protein AGDE_01970 [Angomonas deanei]|uniref:Uncharacterized protein n=1 Tax=Angomonas deanei TaxID=59799 RepID=S9UP40_9TRYP|nr:hypothetical protein AGDE_08511 [Angomonas deanei]EPY41953.1 hypothetical protein AGDE_01970 [Angomonas deanei]CAD2217150.1 hypothetical protein, conserved [Angomonas deanei]|eukprot:EPY32622.1 hypothetical protein AGDE_08511 [Angomonas deanei]